MLLSVYLRLFAAEGNYGNTPFERRRKINKSKGYINGVESIQIERLMEILSFFDDWQDTLQKQKEVRGGGAHDWKRHFITRESWFDLRLCILGFVSTCRYLFTDPSRFKIGNLSPVPRFLSARTFSQVGRK